MTLSDPEIIDFPGFPTAAVRYVDHPIDRMPEAMDRAFAALGAAMGRGEVRPTGPAFARYESAPGATASFETGFPVEEPLPGPLTVDGVEIVPSELPATRLATAKHTGAYDGLGAAWQEFLGRLRADGHGPGFPFWEAYDTEPGPDVDPATLVTGLAVPVGPVRSAVSG